MPDDQVKGLPFAFRWSLLERASVAVYFSAYLEESVECSVTTEGTGRTQHWAPIQIVEHLQSDNGQVNSGFFQTSYGLTGAGFSARQEFSPLGLPRPIGLGSTLLAKGPTNISAFLAFVDVTPNVEKPPSLKVECSSDIRYELHTGPSVAFSSETTDDGTAIALNVIPSAGVELAKAGGASFQALGDKALLLVWIHQSRDSVIDEGEVSVATPDETVIIPLGAEDVRLLHGPLGTYSIEFDRTSIGARPIDGVFLDAR